MEPLIRMEGITKTFPGVKALDNISFDILPGEVHVLIGENGAGKSTLMKILSGVYQPTSGKIICNGHAYNELTTKISAEEGIAIVYQELSVINELSILENLFVGKLQTKKVFGIQVVDFKAMQEKAAKVLEQVGLRHDPSTLVGDLAIPDKQLCEIAKALVSGAKVIVLDEPTTSLTTSEVERLHGLIRELKAADADFCIGAACYPEKHPESKTQAEDIQHLKEKVEAGADFLTTQMVFDNNLFFSFLYKLRDAGVTCPVLPGIMPITNANQVERAIKLSGSFMPQRFKSLVDKFGSDPEAMKQAGIIYASDQIIDLYANGITNVHVYSMNKPDVAEGILRNVSAILGKNFA